MEQVERIKRNSKLILLYVILLDIVLTFLAILEWTHNGNIKLVRWTCGATAITLIILFITYSKLSATWIYKWLLGGFFGIIFMGYWLLTHQSLGIVVAFAASCTIILHSDLTFTYFVTSLLSAYGCIVSVIHVLLGSKRLEYVVMEVITILVFTIIWLLINREQTQRTKENELLIQESQQRQDDQTHTLTYASVVLSNLINAANKISTDLKTNMNLSTEAVEQISRSSIDTAMNIQYQTELSSHIREIITELQTISDTIQSNVNRSIETTEAGKMQIDGLANHSQHIVNVTNCVYQEMNALKKNISGIQSFIQTIADISTQINLLSLNASIEVSRLGEAGKGFADIADEIRVLSDNASNATQKIESLLHDFVTTNKKASTFATDTVENIKQENYYIQSVNQGFEDIHNMLNLTKTNVQSLETKCKDLTIANNGIMEYISNLSATREEVAAQSESTVTMQREGVSYSTKITDFLNKMKETAQSLVE